MRRLFGRLFEYRPVRRRRRKNGLGVIEGLESRQLLAASLGSLALSTETTAMEISTAEMESTSAPLEKEGEEEEPPPGPTGPPVPIYNSLLGAPHTIYLDFDGNRETFADSPYGDINTVYYADTPVFTLDNDYTNFSANELAAIEEIWRRVAEDYAPFNVNVTTDLYQYNYYGGVRVAIGGRSGWTGEGNNLYGIEFDVYGTDPRTVWVFSEKIHDDGGADVAMFVAATSSHEVGHHWGLDHHAAAPSTAGRDYIMQQGLKYDRSTWWNASQDDMAMLAGKLGYRADDRGGSPGSATALVRDFQAESGGTTKGIESPSLEITLDSDNVHYTGFGIIERMTDFDYFSFSVGVLSHLTAAVDVAAVGANLDARLELWTATTYVTSSGLTVTASRMLASADGGLGASLSLVLEPGNYFVVVASQGVYGDVGQYTVSAIVSAANPIALNAGVLSIYGTTRNDAATVVNSNGQFVATLTQYYSDGSIRRQWQSSFAPTDVIDMVFRGYSGDDLFENQTGIGSTGYGGTGNDTFNGGTGRDVFFGEDGADTLRGSLGNDELRGGAGVDHLYGGFGDDTLLGEADIDYLFGQQGLDWLSGGDGNDYLYGGEGGDTLHGNDGADHLHGDDPYQTGADYLYGGNGNDALFGGGGDDWLDGGLGHDVLYGHDGHDLLFGQEGDDYLSGGNGNDALYGQDGHDRLFGDAGADYLHGLSGNDYLDGGHDHERDTVYGGTGADTFVQHLHEQAIYYRYIGLRYFWIAEDTLGDLNSAEGDTQLSYYWST